MEVIQLDDEARDRFLADKRLATLSTLLPSGAPTALPLWYGWDGRVAEMFSERRSAKVRRLQTDPRASLLVHNVPPEPARWVTLEGTVIVDDHGGYEAAVRLTKRYVGDPSNSGAAAILQMFEKADLVRLELVPERIRTYAEVY